MLSFHYTSYDFSLYLSACKFSLICSSQACTVHRHGFRFAPEPSEIRNDTCQFSSHQIECQDAISVLAGVVQNLRVLFRRNVLAANLPDLIRGSRRPRFLYCCVFILPRPPVVSIGSRVSKHVPCQSSERFNSQFAVDSATRETLRGSRVCQVIRLYNLSLQTERFQKRQEPA